MSKIEDDNSRKHNLLLIMTTCSVLTSLFVAYVINKMNETNLEAGVEEIIGVDYWLPIVIAFVITFIFSYVVSSITRLN